MNDKKLFQQKKQAQLDELRAEFDMLKAKALQKSTDAQLDLKKTLDTLDDKFEGAKDKLSKIADSGEDAWDTFKDGIESTWDSMRTTLDDVIAKFK